MKNFYDDISDAKLHDYAGILLLLEDNTSILISGRINGSALYIGKHDDPCGYNLGEYIMTEDFILEQLDL